MNILHRIRAQDVAWLLFVGTLLATTPETNYNATIMLVLIGAFQIVEPRLRIFSGPKGRVWSLILKLIFSYLLVGYTHGIDSPYYSIFLVPMVSAATEYRFPIVLVVTAIAAGSYFSFLLPIYTGEAFVVPEGLLSLMYLHVSFFAIISFLVFEQARAKREEMERTRESNRNLQLAQASLRRSERLAALGQLTAGLAHELRNPLGTIRASAEMLNHENVLRKPEVAQEMASYIQSEVDRMNSLVTSFLNFARPLELQASPSDLRALVAELVRNQSMLAQSRGVHLVESIDSAIGDFLFDPALLSIALANLVQNAIQASQAGSTVTIRAGMSAEQVEIVVEDQGDGISTQNLENIFNPFFTTKAEGVGLGLAIVAKIVDEHQGKITTTSKLGAGTTFRVVLPHNR